MFKIKTQHIEEEIVKRNDVKYWQNRMYFNGELTVTAQRLFFRGDRKEVHILFNNVDAVTTLGLPFLRKQILVILTGNSPHFFVVYKRDKWKKCIISAMETLKQT